METDELPDIETDFKSDSKWHSTYLVRTTYQTDQLETVWWDQSRVAADITANRFVRDSVTLMNRKEITFVVLEQFAYQGNFRTAGLPSMLCDVLNGVLPCRKILRVVMREGRIIEYETQKSMTKGMVEHKTLSKVHTPTDQYAGWYKLMMEAPSLHHLCISAPTLTHWHMALQRSDIKIPRRISVWLYKIVHRQSTIKEDNNGRKTS